MWKRILAILLVTILLVPCLIACGSGDVEDTNPAGTTDPTESNVNNPPKTEPTNTILSAKEIAALAQAATVTVTADWDEFGISSGSGFFIDDNGTLITNYHVIDGAIGIEVEFFGGGIYEVTEIVDFDELHDIAILKIDYSGNPYLKIAEDGVVTGETIYTNGSSLGVLEGSFTNGIVSAHSRRVGLIDCIQITAPISDGNSGGPLLNEFGEVVGINSFGYSSGQNLNLAININTLDLLTMDKNWNIRQYMQWYDKEVDRSYCVYDVVEEAFYLSKVHTYHLVTGQSCFASTDDYDLEDYVFGYEEGYTIFVYDYEVEEFDAYCDYLMSIGFEYAGNEEYNYGISYYYEDSFNGFYMDLYVEDTDLLYIYLTFA